jgi:hypothetical protein
MNVFRRPFAIVSRGEIAGHNFYSARSRMLVDDFFQALQVTGRSNETPNMLETVFEQDIDDAGANKSV